jgi:hypothetical protein
MASIWASRGTSVFRQAGVTQWASRTTGLDCLEILPLRLGHSCAPAVRSPFLAVSTSPRPHSILLICCNPRSSTALDCAKESEQSGHALPAGKPYRRTGHRHRCVGEPGKVVEGTQNVTMGTLYASSFPFINCAKTGPAARFKRVRGRPPRRGTGRGRSWCIRNRKSASPISQSSRRTASSFGSSPRRNSRHRAWRRAGSAPNSR